ncbi:MAG: alpha/beta hydrolase [Anaerolineales bacterium]|nr:alpha/beta hydrolase [Anaerolineales bacterium]
MNSFDLGGDGPPLHFLHANGYPPGCYKPLFELLKSEYRVFGMHLRPLWKDAKPQEIQSWHPFSDDLLRFFSDHKPDSIIGVGHSIGGIVTLRAALRDPGKFRALILIDPVLFVPSILILRKLTRALGLGDRTLPLIAGAKKRRRHFDDLDIAFKRYRKHTVFRYMSDQSLWSYIEGITKPSKHDGYHLVYSPEWEAQIYRTGMQDFDIWRNLPKLELPTLFIRGVETNTFLVNAARLVKKKQPKVKIEALERSTHLLPLERPQEVFKIMQSFLKEVL